MQDRLTIIGVDPGMTCGIAILKPVRVPWPLSPQEYELAEVREDNALEYVADRAAYFVGLGYRIAVGIEAYVDGQRRADAAQRRTRQLVRDFTAWAESAPGVLVVSLRDASTVKKWATAKRLAAAGLLTPTKGMRHARDGARHALYSAVKDCGLRDPLSARGWAE